MTDLPTGRVTLLFTDIEGSTRLLQLLGGEAYGKLLGDHHRLMRAAIAACDGHEVKTEGDSFFAVFRRAEDAINAAVAAQREIAAHDWPASAPVGVRMGLHSGEVALAEGEYVGLDVNRAARISGAGHGGQILVSDATRSLVQPVLPRGVRLRDLGTHRLKDLPEPEHLHQLLIDGLRTDFPPPRSLEMVPTNLPHELTSFFGREQELADVQALLEASRLVTLTGAGGTGKTRLALAVASESVGSFPDGVYFIPLATLREPELVVPAVAHAFELAEGDDLHRRLVESIGSRQLLLVLDNFEQVLPAAQDVARLLADTPRLKLFVTSRSRLNLKGEREYVVPPLSVPDPRRLPALPELGRAAAIALFVDRARAVRPDFQLTNENARPVAEICARLDGLPLAIELAAARVRLLSPDAICARLSDRLSLLKTTSPDVSERQRTLRGAIQWSYDLLPDEERPLFRRLGVFLGGAALPLITRVLAADDELDLLEELGSLIDKSLLRRASHDGDEGVLRVEMLESIRDFARERLTEAGEADEYLERHASAFVELAENAEPQLTGEQGGRWLDRLEREHDNLRAAFGWAVSARRADDAVRLCAALWRFWQMRGHLMEGRERAEQAAQMANEQPDQSLSARAHSTAGSLAYWQADWPAARTHYETALELERNAGNRAGIAEALYNLSFAYFVPREDREDVVQAMELAEEALSIYRELDDRAGVAKTVWALGGIADSFPEPRSEAALAYYREASDQFAALGNRPMFAWASFMRAGAEIPMGRMAEARASTKEALKLFVELGDVSGYALCLLGLAVLEWAEGRRESAARLAAAASRIAHGSGVNLADSTGGRWLERFGFAANALERGVITADTALAAVWAEGEALTDEQAIAEALGA